MSLNGRDTPPSIQDGKFGYEPGAISNFEEKQGAGSDILDPDEARKLAREIFSASTNWINSGRRAAWNDSLRAFQNQFPTGSKYLTRDYAYRSNLFRPKTRAMVRNDESVTASAFFSNEDVVSIDPEDQDDQFQVASAELMKALLQYRLTKTIPWFLTVIGARQDGDVMGICCARAGWKYEEAFSHVEKQMVPGEDGGYSLQDTDIMKKLFDEPFINLLAPENIRFEPGADWRDPVKTSPYLVEMIPMYIQDVTERMDDGEWNRISESALRSSTDRADDVTRRAREQGRVPGKDSDSWKPRAFDISWVHRNIVKYRGRDWHYHTLGSGGELLEDPKPLEEVELHGERPYVVGMVVLETHKTYPASKVELVSDLQRAGNDDWNLRFDNVKLSLNPRQFVKTGHGLENQDLTRFAPGKVVLVNAKPDEPIANNIVSWDRPPEPGESAYAEQDRINLDWDELSGTFNAASVQASQLREAPATGMHLLTGAASGLGEYELRVFATTFVEPLIRLLIKLEQAYETDPVILAIAGRQAQLFQKFGLNHITDELLSQSLTTRANVGTGATNPRLKMANLMNVADGLGKIFGPIAAQGANFEEVAKELFGLAGYKDGERFIKTGFDPQVAQLQQELQKLQQKGGGQGAAPPDPSKLQAVQLSTQSAQQIQKMKNDNDARSDAMEMQRDQLAEHSANWRQWLQAQVDLHNKGADHAHRIVTDQASRQHEMAMPQAAPAGGMG